MTRSHRQVAVWGEMRVRNIIGQAVVGDDLYGREYELKRLREMLEQGEHILMLAPRRVGKTSLMLELKRVPPENWDVIYVNVEGGDSPTDCIAAILASLASIPQYRSRFQTIPFSSAIKDVLHTFQSATVEIDVLRIELRGAIGRDWDSAAAHLQARLTKIPSAQNNLLIIIDELPVLISRMLRTPNGRDDADLLLSRLRYWRQGPEFRGALRTLVGGSIGLEGVLRRAGLSGSINDLAPFHLGSWDTNTAVTFLRELSTTYKFALEDKAIWSILELLQDPVPYHVQLFFSALRDHCRGDVACVTPEAIKHTFSERLAGASGTAHLDHYVTRLEIALDSKEYEVARAILDHLSRHRNGTDLEQLGPLQKQSSSVFVSVLRDLEADDYLVGQGQKWCFRSNLLREWWKRHHQSGAFV